MLINSNKGLGKFIFKHKSALMLLGFTSLFYGIYNDDIFGVLVWFLFVFGFLFLISNFGKNATIFKIGSVVICVLYFLLFPLVDFLIKSS